MGAALAAMLLINIPAAHAADADAELRALMDDYWAWFSEVKALSSSMWGDTRNNDKLDDESEAAFAAQSARMAEVLGELYEFDVNALTEEGRINHAAFTWMLEKERKTLGTSMRFMPINNMGGWYSTFPSVVLALPYASEQDYRDLLSRYRAFDDFAEQNMALMRRGIATGYTQPCETLEGYADTIAGYIAEDPEATLFYKPFAAMPEVIDAGRAGQLQSAASAAIDDTVMPAYRRFLAFYNDEYLPACRENIALSSVPGGRAVYDHLLTFYTSLETDAETVHALGLAEMKRIRGEMDAIIEEVGFEGDFQAFLEFLRTDPQFYATDAQAYLNHAAWLAKKADGLLPRYFSTLPSMPYGISVIPDHMAPKTTTAFYQPGAIDGSRAGQYFLNTYKLESRPLYELPALSVHEAVPGHHLQLAFQAENESLPDWRRSYYFQAFGEGWGLYTEFLGEEMGMYETPYELFGRYIYEAWRAARLVVDTGMHAKGWSRQQAIDYMLANTGLTEQNVISEIDRYITYPAQATAYKHGELKIRELRQRAEQALGDDFDLRDFHVAVIGDGSMPLVVLEEKVDRWIASRQP